MAMDLKNDIELKKAISLVLEDTTSQDWVTRLTTFLEEVQKADLNTRSTKDFHQLIWEDNPVSNVGMGTVNISAALDDEGFRRWVAEESLKPLPENREELEEHMQAFFDQLVSRITQFSKRKPMVKILRVMAAFFPRHFTSLAANARAIECHKAFFDRSPKKGIVKYQMDITERLTEILGEVKNEPQALAVRMTLPWRLFTKYIQKSAESSSFEEEVSPGKTKLKPLPALQRRKGLTSFSGGMATIISAISFVEDGVSKDELITHLRAEFPNYREGSLGTVVSILKNEFRVIHQEGDVISPTTRGTAMLEVNEPEELMPVLLTRILGFDNVLLYLKQKKSADITELVDLLKTVNPGWTSDFAPRGLLKWLRDFGLVEIQNQTQRVLTERGRNWADQITWVPESLPKPESLEEVLVTSKKQLDINTVKLKSLTETIKKDLAFSDELIQRLHLGLWSHSRRHFAIMAGLSGSGKTLLAKRYAEALAQQFMEKADTNVFIQVVQPGWYDPTPLFGYVNPLSSSSYVRPAMLDFLLRASQYPEQPFVVILDEMNLSHPEQYFAPILSAMETGDALRLHNEGESFDGVPCAIPYPENVAFIGTVNMDETTHGISDKVLDRAYTLEFWDIDLAAYPSWGSRNLNDKVVKKTRDCLQQLLTALSPVRLHFGWRTVDDVLDYIDLAHASGESINLDTILDDVVYARVLPKLRGTETIRLRTALDQVSNILKEHGLEKSRRKVTQLMADMTDTGIMRFWR